MKIGILTYHRSHNYGAFLQAYALSQKLNSLDGISCEIVNYNLTSEDSVHKKRLLKRPIYFFQYLKQDRIFKLSQKKQLLSGELVLDNSYDATMNFINRTYDLIICGSDEIWRVGTRGFPNIYWLPAKLDIKKASYAASGRMSLKAFGRDEIEALKQIYQDFDYLGVRDGATKELVESLCPDKKVCRNCDPAFLYNDFKSKAVLKEEFHEKYNISTNKKIITIMYDRPNAITKLRKFLGEDYYFVCIARPMWNADKNLACVSPFEWVDILGASDYLVSSYFHGMLFALLQNTPFSVIDRRAKAGEVSTSKLYDFLSYENLLDRYLISAEVSDADWKNLSDKISLEVTKAEVDFSSVIVNQKKLFDEFLAFVETVGESKE